MLQCAICIANVVLNCLVAGLQIQIHFYHYGEIIGNIFICAHVTAKMPFLFQNRLLIAC